MKREPMLCSAVIKNNVVRYFQSPLDKFNTPIHVNKSHAIEHKPTLKLFHSGI